MDTTLSRNLLHSSLRDSMQTTNQPTHRMKKLLRELGKARRKSIKRLLIENSNNKQDGYSQACIGYDNPVAQNTFNTHEEQSMHIEEEITVQAPVEPLGEQHNLDQRLIQYVPQDFPKPPAVLDKNLQQHLLKVQDTMLKGLQMLGPGLEREGQMGCLIDRYHRQAFDHLNDLLQSISSSQSSLVLMKWVLHTYLSPELLFHPDLQRMDPIRKVDFLLLTEWVKKAQDKLLKSVQTEVRSSLEKILEIERNQEGCHHEEACVGFYVDIVQCVDAIPKEAQKISSSVSDEVQEVCFRELLAILRRYTTEQTEFLGRKAKLDKPETIHFFKTLNTCKELKQHIQTRAKGIEESLLQEMVATLETMEAFAQKLLMDIVADIAERNHRDYFKTMNRQYSLTTEVQTHFPKLMWCQDVQKRVMDEAYQLIAHIYLKHLVRSSQSKLKRYWSLNIGLTVTRDAEFLHMAISDLAPGVQQWNLMLLRIAELLDCQSIDAVKLTVASMQKECPTWSSDQKLVPELLRWIGLSRRQVMEVQYVLPDEEPRTRYVSWYYKFICW